MPTITEELERLVALRDSGALTPAEFEEQKRILLADGRQATTPPPDETDAPQEIGAYRLLAPIGEGGMGAVYLGRHRSETFAERQGGDVAIKVMHPQFARDPSYRARFEREAGLGLELEHPGIVRVRDLIVDGGDLALVMDHTRGARCPISWGPP